MPSYLLKVTKFLSKISQFELLVMTKKNIFAYKLFFVITYFRFYFLCEIANPPPPPLKKSPPPSQQPPLKVEALSRPPLFENLVGGSTPPAERGMYTTYELCIFYAAYVGIGW